MRLGVSRRRGCFVRPEVHWFSHANGMDERSVRPVGAAGDGGAGTRVPPCSRVLPFAITVGPFGAAHPRNVGATSYPRFSMPTAWTLIAKGGARNERNPGNGQKNKKAAPTGRTVASCGPCVTARPVVRMIRANAIRTFRAPRWGAG